MLIISQLGVLISQLIPPVRPARPWSRTGHYEKSLWFVRGPVHYLLILEREPSRSRPLMSPELSYLLDTTLDIPLS
jgi:hypothetical protein